MAGVRWPTAGLVAAAVVLAAQAPAARAQSAFDDQAGFEAVDRLIEERFATFDATVEDRFRQLDAAIDRAYAEVEARVGRVWGQEKRLPEQKVWVGYDPADLGTRVIADYETGVVAIESVDDGAGREVLESRLRQVLTADSRALDRRDILEDAIKAEVVRSAPAVLVPAPRAKPVVNQELGRLVAQKAAPVHSSRPTVLADGRKATVRRVEVPMIAGRDRLSAEALRGPVSAFADHYGLPRSLVLAIIKNESAFNPRAKSPVPAFGLMQLVPSTGGRDAYRLVHGQDRAPSPDFLYQPRENIELGAAYLHLLDGRYLSAVSDRRSRLYCAIAAYNTGAGNVARAFNAGTSPERAARTINAMAPEDVYRHLLANLPYEETRRYLPKVRKDMERFADWDKQG